MPPPEMSIPLNQAVVSCGVASDGETVIPLLVESDGKIAISAAAGGATSANQETEIARLDTVITKLNGGLPAALGAGGGVKIDGSGTALPVSLASLPALPSGSNTIGKVDQGAAGLAAWKVDGSSVTQPVSGTVTAAPIITAANTYARSTSTNAAAAATGVVKNSPGNVYAVACYNANASPRFFQIWDSDTSGGTGTLKVSMLVAPGGQTMFGQDFFSAEGMYCATGIAFGFSSAASTYAAGSAGDCVSTVNYK